MFESLTPSPDKVRPTQRKLLLALFLMALGLTVIKYFYDRNMLIDRPLTWQENPTREAVEAGIAAGVPQLILVADLEESSAQEWLDLLESPEVRREIRLLGMTTARIDRKPSEVGQPSINGKVHDRSEVPTEFNDWVHSHDSQVLILLPPELEPQVFQKPDKEDLVAFLREARNQKKQASDSK